MTSTPDEIGGLAADLSAALACKGWSPDDASEIVDVAIGAAYDGIASLVSSAGRAKACNRDTAIILALFIMERLSLPQEEPADPWPVLADGQDNGLDQDCDNRPVRARPVRAC